MPSPSRRRAGLAAGAVALVLGGALTTAYFRPTDQPPTSPTGATTPPASATAAEPVASEWTPSPLPSPAADVWTAWAYLDSADGGVKLGGRAGPAVTAGLLRPMIVADFLAQLDAAGVPPTAADEATMRAALVDSDNAAADQLYDRAGGDGLARIAASCDLGDPGDDWRTVRLTASATAALGACLREGVIVPDVWASWILDQMRAVRGDGRFGPIESHPMTGSRPLAIVNGWEIRAGQWHVNCLAIGDWWTAAILTRYPAGLGRRHGEKVCADVTAAVVPPDTETAPGETPAPSSIPA